MATPQPSSPGDAREDHAAQVGGAVGALYASAEAVLISNIAELARKVAARVLLPAVAQRRLAAMAGSVLAAPGPRARAAAGFAAEDLGPLLDQAVATAAKAALEALRATIAAADAAVDSTTPGNLFARYQQAVDRALGQHPGTSSMARLQAAQQALDDLAQQGLTGFVDRRGRRWDLAAYVEMATRTAVSNSWDKQQAEALARVGTDLVVVGTHSTEGSCPQCLPWLGRTLSLAGLTPGHPTLADAKAAGFRHPNCRCSWGPELLAAPSTDDLARSAAVYKAAQRQRALERRVREAHRRTAAAVTPAARAEGRRRLRATQAASDQHRLRHGLDAATSWHREHPRHAR